MRTATILAILGLLALVDPVTALLTFAVLGVMYLLERLLL